jgi:predicted small secreted protein
MPMSRIFTVLALLLVLATAACNTMQGAGEDVQRAGRWIERKAQ